MSLSEVQYTQNKDTSEHDCLIITNLQSIQNYEVEYKFSKSSSNKMKFGVRGPIYFLPPLTSVFQKRKRRKIVGPLGYQLR